MKEIPIGFVQQGRYRVQFPVHLVHFTEERVNKMTHSYEKSWKILLSSFIWLYLLRDIILLILNLEKYQNLV